LVLRLTQFTSLETVKELALRSNRLVYGLQTCWWKIGDPCYELPSSGLPCGPRGEILLETDDPIAFIQQAEQNPNHYGKHGINAFMAAYHGNLITEKGLPTSLETWDMYNDLIDELTD